MKKESIPKLFKNVGEIKDKATQMGKEAVKTVGTIKQAVGVGIEGSKSVINRATESLSKQNISQSANVTAKGLDIVAKGARIASKGYETLASSAEKAAEQIKKAGNKLKDK